MLRLLLLLLSLAAACQADEDFPFRNVSLPWPDRADDLVGRLTAQELVQQLAKGGGGPFGGPAPAIARLGIGPYQWNTECLRGAVKSGQATSFPQAVGLAATFDPDILSQVGRATGLEVRAKHNDFVAKGDYGDHTGLTCFAPVINILRHPLWGRNQETYGEDPHLSGVLGAAYVGGLQGNATDRYLLTGAGCKHFAAYDGPDSYPESRFGFNALVSQQDLEQTFLPQFRRCVEAGSVSVMCSYNAINGVPACANAQLLRGVLRERWNFTGYVVSDAGALEFAILFHKYFADRLSSAIGSLRAGVNLDLSACPYESCVVFEQLSVALNTSRISEAELRAAAWPLFLARLRLGEFDPPALNPYSSLRPDQFIQSAAHRALSLTAAQTSLVLLKNLGGFLPDGLIKRPGLRLGVVGPLSDDMSLVYGDYSPNRMPQFEQPLLPALKERFGADKVSHATYCTDGGVYCTRQDPAAVSSLIAQSDVLLAVVGTSVDIETEALDRRQLTLPDGQLALLRLLTASGRPVVLAVVSGAPVGLDEAIGNDSVRAVVWCGYPAQTFGPALINLLTGRYSPSAALPFTWPSERAQLPSITDYDLAARNQTYRFSEPWSGSPPPLFRFGQGLSYCRFSLTHLTAPASISAGQDLHLSLRVAANASTSGISECPIVLKAYLTPPTGVGRNPTIWLASFRKFRLQSGSSASTVSLSVLARDMQLWDGSAGLMRQLPGNYGLLVGDYFDESCADCRVRTSFKVVS
uniref:Fn3_like domain-containing protein n=1 Tax=Macrostomum lignano TaxID=282301 RepID=A0A1I8JFU3_9PLAT